MQPTLRTGTPDTPRSFERMDIGPTCTVSSRRSPKSPTLAQAHVSGRLLRSLLVSPGTTPEPHRRPALFLGDCFPAGAESSSSAGSSLGSRSVSSPRKALARTAWRKGLRRGGGGAGAPPAPWGSPPAAV